MPNPWPLVPLGEVLTQDQRYIDAPDPKEYRKLSVKLYGKGVVLDAPADGTCLKMQRHQIAKSGQVILSEIWGKKGAIGFVPPEGDRALCTSHFFLFDLREDKIIQGYLQAIFTSNYLQNDLDEQAKGTTGYAAVRPKNLLVCKIPLPPLDEQRRIVARIERLAAKIDEARHIQANVVERCDALCRSTIFGKPDTLPVPTVMGTIVKLREPDIDLKREATYRFAGVYCFGKGVFPGATKSGMEFEYSRLTRLRVGDFVYPKLMAWEGALGVVPPDCDGLVVSPEFPAFEVDKSQVLPETLDVYFRTPSVWPFLAEISTGTNVRRRRLHPSAFLKFEMPLPKMDTQVRLREVKRRVDAIKLIQAETAAELDALLPSILDRAFRGELVGAVREPPLQSTATDALKQREAGSTA